MIITLEEARQHLNIDDDFVEDDNYIIELINVAESIIVKDTRQTLAELILEGDGVLPKGIEHAGKLLIGHFYNNREIAIIGVSVNKLPLSYEYLIEPYKVWTLK